MTEKLFYKDSGIKEFTAKILRIWEEEGGYTVELDRTAFFPEAGGQGADTGTLRLSGGELFRVTDVRTEDVMAQDKPILHRILPMREEAVFPRAGDEVRCALDWDLRFAKMQNHSAEHIVSGLVHKKFGYENVGFHIAVDGSSSTGGNGLPSGEVTFDFNGELSQEELRAIEREANRIVFSGKRITTSFPEAEALPGLSYRSKLELTENVRLVTIEDTDVCACCAPHVENTGAIGLIKFLDTERYKGGIRIHMKAGLFALADYTGRYEDTVLVSRFLSCPQSEIQSGLQKKKAAEDSAHEERLRLEKSLVDARIRELRTGLEKSAEQKNGEDADTGGGKEPAVLFEKELGADSIRRVINETVSCAGFVAVFFPQEEKTGVPGEGEILSWRYIIGSKTRNLSLFAKELNAALSGRGGGKPEMIQGSVKGTEEEILLTVKSLAE